MIRPEGYKVYDFDLVRAWPQFQRAIENYHWWRDVADLAHGPSGHADCWRTWWLQRKNADTTAQLHALYERAVHYDVWSDQASCGVHRRRAHLELGVAS